MFVVNCNGKSGGLMLLWKEPIDITIFSYSSGHIDCKVKHADKCWRFTGFYGHPEVTLRKHSWELLRKLNSMHELAGLPWLVGGDFNEICHDSEKLGGNPRPYQQTQAFRDTIEVCSLQDLHGSGDFFTWVNRRSSENYI